jgi:hypothetical protein
MNQTPTAKKPKAINTILLTGFIAGSLDAAAASINFYARTGNSPIRVWRFVASGVFGKNAYADPDSLLMPALGLLFHFCLAFSFTIFFFLLYPKIKLLARNIFVTGILYGFLVWLLMNKIIVPLSNTAKLPPRPTSTILGVSTQTILGMAFILFCIGLPIAFLTSRYYRRKELVPSLS